MKIRNTYFIVLLAASVSAACFAIGSLAQDRDGGEKPGKVPKSKRWKVSWAVDDDAAKMTSTPKPTTIEKLVQFKRPSVLPKEGSPAEHYRTHRIKPIETTVWQIRGTIVNVAAEHDGDYRLTIADEKGRKIIGVMPDPALAPIRGRFSDQLDAARAIILKKFKPTFEGQDVRIPVILNGLGYFGKMNPEENPSPEGFQLHPVIKVAFPGK